MYSSEYTFDFSMPVAASSRISLPRYEGHVGRLLARSIHEALYYNRRYAATTSLTVGGLVAQSINTLFPSQLPVSVSRGDYTISR